MSRDSRGEMTGPKTHHGPCLAAALAVGFMTACSGGDPAAPSLENGISVVITDAGATIGDAGVNVVPDATMDVAPPICPRDDVPDACPSPPPSWLYSARIIVETKCTPCHYPEGPNPKPDYTSYQNVHGNEGPMSANVTTCAMPPADAAPLTLMERETLLAWLLCGAPNN